MSSFEWLPMPFGAVAGSGYWAALHSCRGDSCIFIHEFWFRGQAWQIRRRQKSVSVATRAGQRLTATASAHPLPIEYELPVASAQVKSAVLRAGMNTQGIHTVDKPKPTRGPTDTQKNGREK